MSTIAERVESYYVEIHGCAVASKPVDCGDEALVPEEELMPGDLLGVHIDFFKIYGNSMDTGEDDAICNGDWVRVNLSDRSVREGHVYLFQVDGGCLTVKRAQHLYNEETGHWEWWLCSDNPDFEDFQVESGRVLGRVLGALEYKPMRVR